MTTTEFTAIYDHHFWAVFNFAKHRLADLHDWYYAEEVTSYVFIHLWNAQPFFEDEKSVKAWLMQATVRRVIDVVRELKRKPTDRLTREEYVIADMDEFDRLEIESEVLRIVAQLVAGYAERDRQIYDLHFRQGFPAGKVAEILKTKQQTVSNQLVTLRKKILNEFKYKEVSNG